MLERAQDLEAVQGPHALRCRRHRADGSSGGRRGRYRHGGEPRNFFGLLEGRTDASMYLGCALAIQQHRGSYGHLVHDIYHDALFRIHCGRESRTHVTIVLELISTIFRQDASVTGFILAALMRAKSSTLPCARIIGIAC